MISALMERIESARSSAEELAAMIDNLDGDEGAIPDEKNRRLLVASLCWARGAARNTEDLLRVAGNLAERDDGERGAK